MDFDEIEKRKTAPPGVIPSPIPSQQLKQQPAYRASSIINKSTTFNSTNSSSTPSKPPPPPPIIKSNDNNENAETPSQPQPTSLNDSNEKKGPPKITPRSSTNQISIDSFSSNSSPVSIAKSPSTSSNSLLTPTPPIRSSISIESLVSDLDGSDVSDDEEVDDDTDEEEEEMHENFLKDVIGKNSNLSVAVLKEQERKDLEAMAGGSKFRVTRCFVGPVVPTGGSTMATTTTSSSSSLSTTTGSGRQLPRPPSAISGSTFPQQTNNLQSASVATTTTSPLSSSPSTNNVSTSKPPIHHQPSTFNNQQNRKTIINPVIHRPLPPKKPLPPPPARKTPPQPVVNNNPKMNEAALKIQRAYRNYKLRLPYIKLKVLYRYRWNIIQEIVNTEKTYLNTLNQLSTHFIEPLRRGNILSNEDVRFIFNGIDSILAINTTLLNGLMEVLANWTPYSCLGKYFSKMIHFLRAYTDYVKNFDFVLQRISQCAHKDSKFQSFITAAEDKCTPKARLESMLITPVQRIPRYVLLLQDLLKHTEDSHPDFKDISESLEQMKNVAMQINDTKRQSDNSLKVVEVQNKLVGKFSNIVTAERRYVYEGFLFVGDHNAKSKKIYLFLFNDILIFAKPSSSAKLFNKTKFKFLKCEDLFPSPLLTDIPNNPLMQNCFEIVVQSVEMRFFAENQESKSVWLSHLQKVFSEIEKNQAKDEMNINIKKAEEKAKEFKAYVGYQYAALKYKGARGATLSSSAFSQQMNTMNGGSGNTPGEISPNTSSTNVNSQINISTLSLNDTQTSVNGDPYPTTTNNVNNSNFIEINPSGNSNNLSNSTTSAQPPSLYRQATFHKMSYQTRMETIKDAEEKTQQLLAEEQLKQEQMSKEKSVEDKMNTMKEKLPNLIGTAPNKPASQTFGRSTMVDEKKSKSSPSLNKIFSIGISSSEKDKKDKEKEKDKKSNGNSPSPTNAKLAPQKSNTNLKALNNELSSSAKFNTINNNN